MKKILSVLFSSLLLLSCSSMEVPFEELYGNLLPGDFNWQEFAALNPDIKCAQSLGYIKSLNTAWKLEKAAEGQDTTALIRADSAGFIGTKAAPGAGVRIVKKCYQWTDDGLVDALFNETGTSQNLFPENSLRYHVLEYNLYGRTDEEAFIENLRINPNVYSETYMKWGQIEGRPYRVCKDGEKQTPRSDILIEFENDLDKKKESYRIPGSSQYNESTYDYSDYKFCADNPEPPYSVYVIQ